MFLFEPHFECLKKEEGKGSKRRKLHPNFFRRTRTILAWLYYHSCRVQKKEYLTSSWSLWLQKNPGLLIFALSTKKMIWDYFPPSFFSPPSWLRWSRENETKEILFLNAQSPNIFLPKKYWFLPINLSRKAIPENTDWVAKVPDFGGKTRGSIHAPTKDRLPAC